MAEDFAEVRRKADAQSEELASIRKLHEDSKRRISEQGEEIAKIQKENDVLASEATTLRSKIGAEERRFAQSESVARAESDRLNGIIASLKSEFETERQDYERRLREREKKITDLEEHVQRLQESSTPLAARESTRQLAHAAAAVGNDWKERRRSNGMVRWRGQQPRSSESGSRRSQRA